MVFTAAIGASEGRVKFSRDQDEQPGDNYYKEGKVPRALSGSTVAVHRWGSYDVQQVTWDNLGQPRQPCTLPLHC
jgi:hypothetical protein